MRRKTYFIGLALALGWLMISAGMALAADPAASVSGSWEMSIESSRGTRTQTLKLEQDGNNIKGTLTGRRGESPVAGSVTENKIKFTLTRETDNGTFTIEYSGDVAGDSMKGTFHSERFDGEWTAKRAGGSGK
jgi:hypothetical protein